MRKEIQFLLYSLPDEEGKVQVVIKDETLWCTQKAMAQLFGVGVPAISKHLKNIFEEGELSKNVVVSKMEITTQHGAMEGNGRSTRIWLDLMLKRSLKRCVDWSKIDKNDYLNAMRMSVSDDTEIRRLLKGALTDEIDSREMFMKGIDYSYYYEQED